MPSTLRIKYDVLRYHDIHLPDRASMTLSSLLRLKRLLRKHGLIIEDKKSNRNGHWCFREFTIKEVE